MSKEFNYEKWKENYYNNRHIDIIKFLSKEDIELIKKLNVKIEQKVYTEHELEILYLELLEYYKADDIDKEDLEFTKSLDGTGVAEEQYHSLVEKFNKINTYYNL